MHEFTLNMLGYQRPVIKLYGSDTLIDTGALIPMTTFSPEVLKLAWNAELVLQDASIGGIGGQAHGSVYALKDFEIGDFHFDKLEIFVPDKADFKFPFLISATLLYGTHFSMDMRSDDAQTLTIQVPDDIPLSRTFEIKSLDGKLCAQIDGILIQEQDELRTVDNFLIELDTARTDLHIVTNRLEERSEIFDDLEYDDEEYER